MESQLSRKFKISFESNTEIHFNDSESYIQGIFGDICKIKTKKFEAGTDTVIAYQAEIGTVFLFCDFWYRHLKN